jgi:acyl-CoA thioesterase-1
MRGIIDQIIVSRSKYNKEQELSLHRLVFIGLLTCTLLLASKVFAQTNDSESNPITIAFLGDSLTAGYRIGQEAAYPNLVGEKLKARGYDVEIINAGVSGDTTAGGLRRVDWLLRRRVDLLVIALGANDMLRGQSPKAARSNLQGIIDKAKAKYPNIKILLAGMKALPSMGRDYVDSFEPMFKELAVSNEVEFIPFLLKDVAGKKDLNLPDRIHPNAMGHKVIAKNVLPFILKLIGN